MAVQAGSFAAFDSTCIVLGVWQAASGKNSCLEKSPGSWLAALEARPSKALVALAKLCVLARMLAAVVDTKLDTLLRRLATVS